MIAQVTSLNVKLKFKKKNKNTEATKPNKSILCGRRKVPL